MVHRRDKVHVHKFVPNDKIHRNDDYVKRVPVLEIIPKVSFFTWMNDSIYVYIFYILFKTFNGNFR